MVRGINQKQEVNAADEDSGSNLWLEEAAVDPEMDKTKSLKEHWIMLENRRLGY